MDRAAAARKRADLPSLAGAALPGLALGAGFRALVRPLAWFVPGGGLLVHGVGMAARHRLDRATGALTRGWQPLDLACWILILAILAIGVARWAGVRP